MVSKITIFEARFEDVQFGPMSTGTAADEVAADGHNVAGSSSRLVTVLQGATVFVVLFVVLWTVLSRLFAEDEDREGPADG